MSEDNLLKDIRLDDNMLVGITEGNKMLVDIMLEDIMS